MEGKLLRWVLKPCSQCSSVLGYPRHEPVTPEEGGCWAIRRKQGRWRRAGDPEPVVLVAGALRLPPGLLPRLMGAQDFF